MTEPNVKARQRAVFVHMRSRISKEVDVEFIDRSDWEDVGDDPTGLHKPFGFMPHRLDRPRIAVEFCAEIIAEQGLHLSDEDFTRYLQYLEGHVHMHVSHTGETQTGFYDDDELEAVIDRTLTEAMPRLVSIANQVQLQALDPQS